MHSREETTQALAELSRGDTSAAGKLLPAIYEELHILAKRFLRRERSDHTLNTTALVHEAYLRLVDQRDTQWQDRAHFHALASAAIRRVLMDHARRRRSIKRGGEWHKVTLDDNVALSRGPSVDLLGLDEAMARLAQLDERQSRVVELRFFGGLSVDETAHVLGVSPRTVDADWHMARAWLRRELSGEESAGGGSGA
jgi:RNA polymerase sigma factor (TIGR02999 family)